MGVLIIVQLRVGHLVILSVFVVGSWILDSFSHHGLSFSYMCLFLQNQIGTSYSSQIRSPNLGYWTLKFETTSLKGSSPNKTEMNFRTPPTDKISPIFGFRNVSGHLEGVRLWGGRNRGGLEGKRTSESMLTWLEERWEFVWKGLTSGNVSPCQSHGSQSCGYWKTHTHIHIHYICILCVHMYIIYYIMYIQS